MQSLQWELLSVWRVLGLDGFHINICVKALPAQVCTEHANSNLRDQHCVLANLEELLCCKNFQASKANSSPIAAIPWNTWVGFPYSHKFMQERRQARCSAFSWLTPAWLLEHNHANMLRAFWMSCAHLESLVHMPRYQSETPSSATRTYLRQVAGWNTSKKDLMFCQFCSSIAALMPQASLPAYLELRRQ